VERRQRGKILPVSANTLASRGVRDGKIEYESKRGREREVYAYGKALTERNSGKTCKAGKRALFIRREWGGSKNKFTGKGVTGALQENGMFRRTRAL